MEILLGTACVCLLVILIVLLWKYLSLKKNIRHFLKELEKLKDSNYRQPVKVTDFDKDLVELAVKVNEHIDIQRQLGVEYDERKKQLGVIISGISHDFRTPLTASLGYLQLIEKSGELSEKNAEYLGYVVRKNIYLKELSDEFFEFSLHESKAEKNCLTTINLSNILVELLLEQHEWIEECRIKTDFNISDGVLIESDANCINRILNNLVSNSKKYAVSYIAVELKKSENTASLCFKNDIDTSDRMDIKNIFEPFYRSESRTKSGAGIGLYVVKRLSDKLGADLHAELHDKNIFSIAIKFTIN